MDFRPPPQGRWDKWNCKQKSCSPNSSTGGAGGVGSGREGSSCNQGGKFPDSSALPWARAGSTPATACRCDRGTEFMIFNLN